VDVPSMVRDLQELLAKPLAQRNLVFITDMPRQLDSQLLVSQGDLFQVLLNLVQNAIDCSRANSLVTLGIRAETACVTIAVSDEGPGIAQDVLSHIFDPFFTTKSDGIQKNMGLGLSVSYGLVQAMGGTIDVQTVVGRGTTFSVRLPRARRRSGKRR
jgi:two-component system, sporulation sensor kinase C